MTEFRSVLILAGVGVVVLVYLYNWWVSMRRRREIERAVAAHSGRGRDSAPDPLDAAPPVATPAARVEPQVGVAPLAGAEAPAAPQIMPSGSNPPENAAGNASTELAAEPGAPFAMRTELGGRAEPYLPPDASLADARTSPEVRSASLPASPLGSPASFQSPTDPSVGSPPVASAAATASAAAMRPRSSRAVPSGLALRPDPNEIDSRVDYLIRLLPLEPVVAEDLAEMLASAPELGRRMTVLGCPVGGQDWQPVLRQSVRYEELAFALQQVDRGGLVERASLDRFIDWVDHIAEQVSAGSNPPDPEQAHAVAASFDTFCAEADVLIGVNVVAPDVPVPGTKIRALVEAAGFRLQANGQYTLEDDEGFLLVTLADIDGEPFVAERIRTAAMTGVTLLLDIPRTRKPARVFTQMMQIARQIAQGIGGRVVDDQRQNLTDAGIRVISGRIAALENRLTAQQMAPGSALARRVFE